MDGSAGAVERGLLLAQQAPAAGAHGSNTGTDEHAVHPGLHSPAPQPRLAWSRPFLVDGVVNRLRSIPKVLLFYGNIPVAALASDRTHARFGWHLTLFTVKKNLLEVLEDASLFTAEQLGQCMRQSSQLAAEEGLFHEDESLDHETWVRNLGVVLQRAELELNAAAAIHESSAKQVRAAWVSNLGYVVEFEEFHYTCGRILGQSSTPMTCTCWWISTGWPTLKVTVPVGQRARVVHSIQVIQLHQS